MNKSTKEKAYFDYPIIKKLQNNGELSTLENSDALFQAVKVWLCCKKREKLRSIGGGILTPFIGKFMDDDTASEMKSNIIYGLENEFSPSITVEKCEVIPDYDKNCWIIYISGYNSTLNIGINNYVVVKNKGV